MSVDKKYLKNTQNSFQLLAQKGGRGRSATFDSMNTAANAGLGKYPARGVLYESCDSQSGGGYGFTQASVKNADTFRGSYPEYVKYEQTNQCGGRRRRKRKTKKRRKSRRRKSRKSKRKCCKLCKKLCTKSCKKKCKNKLKKCKCKCPPCPKKKRRSRQRGGRRTRRTRRTRRRRTRQRGGSSQIFSSPNPQHTVPWATGPLSIQKVPPTCFDNYNHYTGEQRQ